MKCLNYFLSISFLLISGLIHSQNASNGQINLSNWKFHTGNAAEWSNPGYDDSKWAAIKVPANWENENYKNYDGYACYRVKVVIPSTLKNKTRAGISINLGAIDDRDSTFINGSFVGSVNGWNEPRNYFIPSNSKLIRWDKENVITVKVYDKDGPGGIWEKAPAIKPVDFIDFVRIEYYNQPFHWTNSKDFVKQIVIRNTENFKLSGKLEITTVNNITMAILKKEEVKVELNGDKSFTYQVHSSVPEGVSCSIHYKLTDPAVNRSIETYEGLPYILTPKEEAKPHINGGSVYGVRPGSPIIYRIPVTGERPLKLSATPLPQGLAFDAEKGIITGSITTAGTYSIKLNAENAKGSDSKEFKVIVGDKLMLTPPMGWNSWNCFGLTVSEKNIRATADAFIREGLVNYGWSFVNIDDGWEAPKRDGNGNILANEKFPDMKGLTDYVHGLGLKIGLYSSPGDYTCGNYLGSYRHEKQDATTWAAWGFDYIKYDWCSYGAVKPNPSLSELKEPYMMLGKYLLEQPRDIVYSLCQYGMGEVWKWGNEVNGNLWRTTGDISDSWESMRDIGFSQSDKSENSKPGNWNDPDMLIVGKVGWGNLRPTHLTPDEQYTHISLWSLLAAPLLIGCDMEQLDTFTKSLLCNSEVIDINQDALGLGGKRIVTEGPLQIWVKPLEDGNLAVGMFNLSESTLKDATLKLNLLNLTGKKVIRDVWRQKNIGEFDDTFKTVIPAHGSVLLKISK